MSVPEKIYKGEPWEWDIDRAYLAGIVDGEGSIQLSGAKMIPTLEVTTTDKELIDWIQSKWGGVIVSQKTYKEHHKPAWIWRTSYNRALEILGDIQPYLKIDRKRERVYLLFTKYKQCTPRNGKYTPEQTRLKQELLAEFKSL